MSLYLGNNFVKLNDKSSSFIVQLKETSTPTPPVDPETEKEFDIVVNADNASVSIEEAE